MENEVKKLPAAGIAAIQKARERLYKVLKYLPASLNVDVAAEREAVTKVILAIVHPKTKIKLPGTTINMSTDVRISHAVTRSLQSMLAFAEPTDAGMLHVAARLAGNLEALRAGQAVRLLPSVPMSDTWYAVRITNAISKKLRSNNGAEVTFNVLNGMPAAMQIAQHVPEYHFRRLFYNLGITGKYEQRAIHYRNFVGLYCMIRLKTVEDGVAIEDISGKSSLRTRNKKLYNMRHVARECPFDYDISCEACDKTVYECAAATHINTYEDHICGACKLMRPHNMQENKSICIACTMDAWARTHIV